MTKVRELSGGRVVLTDDPAIARECAADGVCCVLLGDERTPFTAGVPLYIAGEEETEPSAAFLQLTLDHFYHRPFVVGRESRFILREAAASDFDEIYDMLRGGSESYMFRPSFMRQFLSAGRGQAREAFEAYIREAYIVQGFGLWICEISSRAAGIVGFEPPSTLEFFLKEEYRGTGIARAACKMAMDYGADELGMDTIEVLISAENKKALCFAAGLGFSGHQPGDMPTGGKITGGSDQDTIRLLYRRSPS